MHTNKSPNSNSYSTLLQAFFLYMDQVVYTDVFNIVNMLFGNMNTIISQNLPWIQMIMWMQIGVKMPIWIKQI